MKKILLAIIICLLLVGCSNKEKEIDEYIKNSTFTEISKKIEESIRTISYFPSEDSENEFIYYVKGIKNNLEKYDINERKSLYDELNKLNYSFKFNSLNYTNKDYQNDLEIINSN